MLRTIELSVTACAIGGEGIARDEHNKIVFVRDGVPGDAAVVAVDDERTDYARGSIAELLAPSPARVEPACPHVARGCGGCGWQHVALESQRDFKRQMVVDALRRSGRIRDAGDRVGLGASLPHTGFRTTIRALIVDGHCAFRTASSHHGVVVDSCLVAHPAIEAVLRDSFFGDASEATFRFSVASGELLVVVDGGLSDVELPERLHPSVRSVVVARARERSEHATIHETIAGVEFQVSVSSFFQTRDDGAAALVSEVAGSIEAALGPAERGDVLVDLYGGVGLFAATVGQRFRTVVTVERSESASDDAIVNLRAHADATVVCDDVATWDPEDIGLGVESREVVVVADPARAGLGREGVAAVAALEPRAVVLVSCDAGSLGRDARLLHEAGYDLDRATVVDLFPHTPHVEVVSLFRSTASVHAARQ